jgi:hypothetical protein
MHLSREKYDFPNFFFLFFAKALPNIFSLAQPSRPKYKCLTITASLFWSLNQEGSIKSYHATKSLEMQKWKINYEIEVSCKQTTQYFFITTNPTLIFQANLSLGHECLPTWYIHKAESSKCFHLYQHNKL